MDENQSNMPSTKLDMVPSQSSTPSHTVETTPPKTMSSSSTSKNESPVDRTDAIIVDSGEGSSVSVPEDGLGANQATIGGDSSKIARLVQISVAAARYAGPMPPPDLLRA